MECWLTEGSHVCHDGHDDVDVVRRWAVAHEGPQEHAHDGAQPVVGHVVQPHQHGLDHGRSDAVHLVEFAAERWARRTKQSNAN